MKYLSPRDQHPDQLPHLAPKPTPLPVDCEGATHWESSVIYEDVGKKVVFKGNLYESKWYSSDQNPEENSSDYAVWKLLGPCTSGPTPNHGAENQELCGDVNGDMNVDIVDALLIAQKYIGLKLNNFNERLGDMNNDQAINIIDALLVAKFYIKSLISLNCR